MMKKQKKTVEILQALGVEVISIDAPKGNYAAFYENFKGSFLVPAIF